MDMTRTPRLRERRTLVRILTYNDLSIPRIKGYRPCFSEIRRDLKDEACLLYTRSANI